MNRDMKRKLKEVLLVIVLLSITGTMYGCLDTRSGSEEDYPLFKSTADKYAKNELSNALSDFFLKNGRPFVPSSILSDKMMEDIVKNEIKNCEWKFDQKWFGRCNPVPSEDDHCVIIYNGTIDYELLNQTFPIIFRVYINVEKEFLGGYKVNRVFLGNIKIGDKKIYVGEYLYQRPKF